jgi:hypothetical protein
VIDGAYDALPPINFCAETRAQPPIGPLAADLNRRGPTTVAFDYGIPAELFMGKRKGGPRQPLRYRRFATAAEAIRFAVEELPAVRALGAWMQVGDQCFDGDDIRRLYESYPLQGSGSV